MHAIDSLIHDKRTFVFNDIIKCEKRQVSERNTLVQDKRRSRGRPIKLVNYHALVLRLPDDLYGLLRNQAREQKISLNDLLIQITKTWLEEKRQ